MTNDGIITNDNTTKLWDLRDKEIYYHHDRLLAIGLGGRIAHFDWFFNYIHGSDFPNAGFIHHHVIGIVVGERAVYEIETKEGYFVLHSLDSYVSTGSGCDFAKSAMALGKSARGAIEHAKQFDSATGGKVQWLKL